MFSKLYKELYHQRWFRDTCLKNHLRFMRNHPRLYPEKEYTLDKVFGVPPVRSWLSARRKGLL